MNHDDFESIRRGEGPDELSLFSAFSQLAQADRDARTLTQGSLDAGLYAWEHDEGTTVGRLRVAAADQAYPVTYTNDNWRVTLGLDIDGSTLAELNEGPEELELIVDRHRVLLRQGALARLPPLEPPPERIVVMSTSGQVAVLTPLSEE